MVSSFRDARLPTARQGSATRVRQHGRRNQGHCGHQRLGGRAYSGASRAQEAGRRHTPTGSAAYSTSVGVEALGSWTNTTPTAQVDVTESSREPAAGAV